MSDVKKNTGGQPTDADVEAEMLRMLAQEGHRDETDGALEGPEDPFAAEKQALAERDANLQNRDQRLAEAEAALRTSQEQSQKDRADFFETIEKERNDLIGRFDGVLTALKEDNKETVTAQVTRVVEAFTATNTARDEADKKRRENDNVLTTTRQETMTDHVRRTVRKYVIGGVAVVGILLLIQFVMMTKSVGRLTAELIGSDVTEVRKAMVAELQVEHDALISEIRNMRAGLAAEKGTWEKIKGTFGFGKSEAPQVPFSAPQQVTPSGQTPSQVAPGEPTTPPAPAGPAPIKKRF